MNELEYYTKRLKDPSNTELENILLEIKIKEVRNNECKNI